MPNTTRQALSRVEDYFGARNLLQAARQHQKLQDCEVGIAAIITHLLDGPKTIKELEQRLRQHRKALKAGKGARFARYEQINVLLTMISHSSDATHHYIAPEEAIDAFHQKYARKKAGAFKKIAHAYDRWSEEYEKVELYLVEKRPYDPSDLRKKQYELAWWGKLFGTVYDRTLYYLLKSANRKDSRIDLTSLIQHVKEYSYATFYLIVLEVLYRYAAWVQDDFTSFKKFVQTPMPVDDENIVQLTPDSLQVEDPTREKEATQWSAREVLVFLKALIDDVQEIIWAFSQRRLLRTSFKEEVIEDLEQIAPFPFYKEIGWDQYVYKEKSLSKR